MPLESKIWMNVGPAARAGKGRSGIPRLQERLLAGLVTAYAGPLEPCVWNGDDFLSSGHGSEVHFQQSDILISTDFDWNVEYTHRISQVRAQHGVLTVGVLYDLITVLFPHFFDKDLGDRFKRLFMLTGGAFEGLLAISKRTAADFEQFCLRYAVPCPPIKVITLGDCLPDPTKQASPAVETLAQTPFILFVSTIEKRKNHQILLQAYHILRRFRPELALPKLVLVGQIGWGVGELLREIELDPWVRNDIVQLDDCGDADLQLLYEKALFCAYPSLYEGWGLPVGEALAMGKAVICSDQGSLPEVGGDLVRYISPWNAMAWADAIAEFVTSPNRVREMEEKVRRNYRRREWSETAAQVLGFIEELRLAKT